MQLYYTAAVRERRRFEHLIWVALAAPELARAAQPGQFVLFRSWVSLDPLLWPALFLAGADPTTGTVELLIDPRDPSGMWMIDLPVGATVELCMPSCAIFTPAPTTQTLLLAGVGSALPALLFLARRTADRRSVTLALAGEAGFLPPPFLLPATVEMLSSTDGEKGLFELITAPAPRHALQWADQVVFGLPSHLIGQAIAAVRAARLRWEDGFAHVIMTGPLPCGLGVCQACQIETRQGRQRRCVDGPLFDLRVVR
ncbi:iron-sulfur cluster-binding protein [Chloroflexus sp.]|uniref:iron-sulfur cluster-binding protein n=1 Tax=Chloroflexus sp. TaxID=1904827 RepID=UPI002626AAE9|nr:hypothetical protein [uncultured Chloroflexus sp.]